MLCGNIRCGCAIDPSTATTGAVGGAFPTVTVSGIGSVTEPYGFTLDPAWTTAVAAAANTYTAMTDYTPIVAQGVLTDITKNVNYARYMLGSFGSKAVTWTFMVTLTGTGVASSPATVSLPVAAAAGAILTPGNATIFRPSTSTTYNLAIELTSATTAGFVHDTSGNTYWGVTPALALAIGDIISGTATYESV